MIFVAVLHPTMAELAAEITIEIEEIATKMKLVIALVETMTNTAIAGTKIAEVGIEIAVAETKIVEAETETVRVGIEIVEVGIAAAGTTNVEVGTEIANAHATTAVTAM